MRILPIGVVQAWSRNCSTNVRQLVGTATTSSRKEWLPAYLQSPQSGATVRSGLSARQRCIMFRSRNRGWLELDVLLGCWAAKHVPRMKTETEIARVEALLEAETPHLFQWITGQVEPPGHFAGCDVLKSMQDFALGRGVVEEREARRYGDLKPRDGEQEVYKFR